ncbi:hypothetical protein LP316_06510 [Thalassotalea sp. LPB0316]|uniref:hypothetical protein n=1 Tax=Thalassotalea sp. LPB0316 TaxID=2769490 RepID=UPI00186955CA|nr:hypothetical protein [Thalassotalea sp. LPB0316]QOL26938.1 hypothetical protein LP316_06510 [Thalassotalea sp. LPB0316]
MIKHYLAIALTLLLTACANITFKGMYEMATLDIFALDPAQLNIAVRTDKAINLEQGNVVVELSVVSIDETLFIEEKLFAQVSQAKAISGALASGLKSNEAITIFNLSPEDATVMKQALTQAKTYKDNGKKGKGSLAIKLDNVCFERQYLAQAEIDILLQLEKQNDYFMFLENLNLTELANDDPNNQVALDEITCTKS